MAGEPSLAGRLEDLQLSRMAPTNFLIEAYFKAAAGQADAVLTRAASPSLKVEDSDLNVLDHHRILLVEFLQALFNQRFGFPGVAHRKGARVRGHRAFGVEQQLAKSGMGLCLRKPEGRLKTAFDLPGFLLIARRGGAAGANRLCACSGAAKALSPCRTLTGTCSVASKCR